MTNLRKQVIADIESMENTLKHHQTMMIEHKACLQNMLSYKCAVLITTLFPAFIIGWEVARMKKTKHVIKRLIKFGLMTTMASIRKLG